MKSKVIAKIYFQMGVKGWVLEAREVIMSPSPSPRPSPSGRGGNCIGSLEARELFGLILDKGFTQSQFYSENYFGKHSNVQNRKSKVVVA